MQTGNDLLLCMDIPTLAGGQDKCIKAHLSTSSSKRSLSATPQIDGGGTALVDSITREGALVPEQCVDVLPWVYQS